MEENKKSYRDYLNKTFLEELNYKIWSTKGARFKASERLLHVAHLSNVCTSMLSVYLIAVGLVSVYNISSAAELDLNLIAYSTTSLSILILVFGQIENAKDFKMKASQFHRCGLELASIYNELRIFKTLEEEQTLEAKKHFAKSISGKYEKILERYDNHDSIDHDMFRVTKAKYHELEWFNVLIIRFMYYISTSLIYHFLILFPPALIFVLLAY